MKSDVFHDLLEQKHHVLGNKIAVRYIITFIQMAGADKYTVHSIGEGSEYMCHVNSPGAHHSEKSHIGCILQSGNSSQVSSAVCSPIACKTQYFRLKFMVCTHRIRFPWLCIKFMNRCNLCSSMPQHFVLQPPALHWSMHQFLK